jgi:hypothetical protein
MSQWDQAEYEGTVDRNDWEAGQFSYSGAPDAQGTVAYTPATVSQPGFWERFGSSVSKIDVNKALDTSLNVWLKAEQINAQKQLLLAGRSVGYYPYTGAGGLQMHGGLPQILLLGGLVYFVVKALK